MIQLAAPLRSGVHRLSQIPWAFDGLRWILEGGYRNHRRMLSEHFQNPPRRVLDCGCGTGVYADCFAPETYTGIDISSQYIQRARKLHPSHRFRVMDATCLDYPSNFFDAVIVSGVVHHLDDETTQRVIAEIVRVLAPGGALLLWEDVPTRDSLNLVGQLVHSLDVGEHIRSDDQYAQLLQDRLEIETVQPLRSGWMDYIVFKASKPMLT